MNLKFEYRLTDRDFKVLRELVQTHTGIYLSDNKKALIYSRLRRRLKELGLNNFSQYCDILADEKINDETVLFINAVTTNITSFFREAHHFDFIQEKLNFSEYFKNTHRRRLRFWSAGCSTGEEPYSLAMTIKDNLPDETPHNIKILATDLASSVLDVAATGIYTSEKIKSLTPYRKNKWFSRIVDEPGSYQISDELRNMILFRQLNLIGHWPVKGPFDAIFCRNVLIYFDLETQKKIVDKFANLLPMDGYLLLGHSESLLRVTDRFELIGRTIYQKKK